MRHFGIGKGEAGKARQNRRDEKNSVPGAGELAVDEAEQDDETGTDGDEADGDVQCGEDAYAHSKNHEIPLFAGNRNSLLLDAVICCSMPRIGCMKKTL
jgi:hypothetical protein